MPNRVKNMKISERSNESNLKLVVPQNLWECTPQGDFLIKDIVSEDEELKGFLFSLGCFAGETISIISRLADNLVINIKDARYSIDSDLARAIVV